MSEEKPATEKPVTQPEPAKEMKRPVEKQAPLGLADMPVGGEARTELSLMPNCKNFAEVFQLCNWIAESNIVPEAYRGRPADVFVAAEYGSDIGLKFMTSIQNIAIIGGRPALPSDIKLAMVRGKKLLEYWKEASTEEIKKTNIAWCEMKRVDVAEIMRHTYTVDDAKMARVWEKLGRNDYPTPWVTHKWRMLQLKPRDMCLRDLFGDVFKGLHSVEEAQEIQIIEAEQSSQALIEQRSQPETKGREILESDKPPLKPAEEAGVKPLPGAPEAKAAGVARPSDGGQEEGVLGTSLGQTKTQAELNAEQSLSSAGAMAALVDSRAAKLRALPAGSAALLKIWSLFRLPVSKFGKEASICANSWLERVSHRWTSLPGSPYG
jgi:hypothetical protein